MDRSNQQYAIGNANEMRGSGITGRINDHPYILVIGGHTCSGKDALYGTLLTRLQEEQAPVQKVINFKPRGPRSDEIVGEDFLRIDSPAHYRQLEASGDIIIGYYHPTNKRYGLSRDFKTALEHGNVPMMMTDASAVSGLINYINTNQLSNKLISFMLHTSPTDARDRLYIKRNASRREINERVSGLQGEFSMYEKFEGLFRHVFANPTVEGETKDDRTQHLASRAWDILALEERLGATTKTEFREAYVRFALEKLFTPDVVGDLIRLDPGNPIVLKVPLNIPIETIEKYAIEKGVGFADIGDAVSGREIVAATRNYGTLSLYLPWELDEKIKEYLVELIEQTIGLTHQYRKVGLSPSMVSKHSLARVDSGNLDFFLSFSPYDGMNLHGLKIDSPTHALAFTGVHNNPNPHLTCVDKDVALEYIASQWKNGNGSAH